MDNKLEIPLPSRLKTVSEEGNKGIYEISGLYPGYGYTLGNSLRRIILSSLPGCAITTVKIDKVNHEFSTVPGIKEDIINIILNLKRVRFKMNSVDEPQTFTTKFSKEGEFKAGNLNVPSQLEVVNPESLIATLTDKNASITIELTVEKGLGYVLSGSLKNEKMPIGVIMVDAIFTPIRKVNYEVENMRVGDKTDYNLLRFIIETDGSLTPREAVDRSLAIMFKQVESLIEGAEEIVEERRSEKDLTYKKEVGFNEDERELSSVTEEDDPLKIRIEDLVLSSRTMNALSLNSIRTVGGIVKKKEEDLLSLDGIGQKAVKEIKEALRKLGLSLK